MKKKKVNKYILDRIRYERGLKERGHKAGEIPWSKVFEYYGINPETIRSNPKQEQI